MRTYANIWLFFIWISVCCVYSLSMDRETWRNLRLNLKTCSCQLPPLPPSKKKKKNSDARLHCERVDDATVKGWQFIYIRLNSLYFNFKNLWVFVYPKVRNRIKQCVPLEYCQIKSLLLPLMCFNLLGFFLFFQRFFFFVAYVLRYFFDGLPF